MNNEISIDLNELTKVYVVCPNQQCGTEIAFDLTERGPLVRPIICPVCNEELLAAIQVERGVLTWISFLQRIIQAEQRPRMIFRLPRPR